MWRDPYIYVANFVGAQALAANGVGTIGIPIDREGDFAIYRTAHLATSVNYRVMLTDQNNRLLLGGVAPATNLFGDGQRPFRWPAARVIKRTDQVLSQAQDRSGALNTIRQIFVGAHLLPAAPFAIPPFRYSEPYSIEINFGAEADDGFGAVPANGIQPGAAQVPGDSWFEIHALTISRTAAATLQITTNGNREWFRQPIHVDLLGASDFVTALNTAAQWPFEFNPPKLLDKNTAIAVQLVDLSGAVNAVRLTFWGLRRYEGAPPALAGVRRRSRPLRR